MIQSFLFAVCGMYCLGISWLFLQKPLKEAILCLWWAICFRSRPVGFPWGDMALGGASAAACFVCALATLARVL